MSSSLLLFKLFSNLCPFPPNRELLAEVINLGKTLRKIDSAETVVENIVQRIIKLILDESVQTKLDSNDSKTYSKVELKSFFQPEIRLDCKDINMEDFRDQIVIAIGELTSELEASGVNIAKQSLEMIHTSEIIMTIGRSKTVEMYLKHAAKSRRKFQVIVAECAPFCNGHELAASLAAEGISTMIIPDSGIFSVMNRVNKVVIGTHSIMANGGIKAVSGANVMALAAKHYSVPVRDYSVALLSLLS